MESRGRIVALSSIYLIIYLYSVGNYVTVDTLAYQTRDPLLIYKIFVFSVSLAPALWMPNSIDRPTKVVYVALYYSLYVPSITIPFYLTKMSPNIIIEFSLVILLSFFIIGSSYRISIVFPEIKQLSGNRRYSLYILSLGILLIFAVVINSYSLHHILDVPGLREVYNTRDVYKNADTATLDLVSIGMYVFFPALLSMGLLNSSKGLIGIGILGELLIYSIGGHRATVAITVGVIGLYVVYSRYREFFPSIVAILFVFIALLPIISTVVNISFLSSIVFERFLISPGMISGLYFEYFSENPKATEEFLPFFYYLFEDPYDKSMPLIIGSEYFYSDTHSNGSFIASGFGSLGYAGIVLNSIIISISFWIYDSFSIKSDSFAILILVGPTFMLQNTSLSNLLNYEAIFFPVFLLFRGEPVVSIFGFGEIIVAMIIVYLYSSELSVDRDSTS